MFITAVCVPFIRYFTAPLPILRAVSPLVNLPLANNTGMCHQYCIACNKNTINGDIDSQGSPFTWLPCRNWICQFPSWYHYWVASMAIPVGKWVGFVSFILFIFFSFFFPCRPGKSLACHSPLVSSVFLHRAFWAYFLRIERVVEMRRFLWWTQ